MYVNKKTIPHFNTVEHFVWNKINLLEKSGRLFDTLCELMFSEKDNILFEETIGFANRKTTYGQAYKAMLGISDRLHRLINAPADSVVGLYMDNGPEWIECLWAILRCGYKPLLLNARLSDEMLEQTLKDMSTAAVVSDGRTFSVRTVTQEELFAGEPAPGFTPGDFGTEILIMSSGTSRFVKVCGYTADRICSQIKDSFGIISRCSQMRNHFEGELKQLAFIPFYHVFGLTAVYFWFGFFSRTFVKLKDLNPATIQKTIRDHKVTHIFAVPLFWNKVYSAAIKSIDSRDEKTREKFRKGMSVYRKLYGLPALQRLFSKIAMKQVRDNMFGESVQFAISGGSGISPEVLEFFNAVGYHMANGYGTTESGITSVELGRNALHLCSGTVGKPFNSVRYKIDEAGLLLVSGESMSAVIYRGGERMQMGEWFNTHDLAEESGGRYFILGRNDDIIISAAGENINPDIYEPQLMIKGVEQVCLLNSKTDGIVILAFRSISELSDEDIKNALSERAEQIKLIGEIKRIVITERPLIAETDFKLDRIGICERYDRGEYFEAKKVSDASSRENGIQALVLAIKKIFCDATGCGTQDVSVNSNFFTDLGGDSLGYLGMIAELEEIYGVEFPSIGERSLGTIEQITEYIEEHGAWE